MNYTEEQIQDIKARETKAIDMLKDLELGINAALSMVNIGDNVFATKVIVTFNDLKYVEKPEKTKEEKVKEIIEAKVK